MAPSQLGAWSSHYLEQSWPHSMMQYKITRTQKVMKNDGNQGLNSLWHLIICTDMGKYGMHGYDIHIKTNNVGLQINPYKYMNIILFFIKHS